MHIINLLEILVYISYHEYLLIMNAKFHSSMMNIAHTMSLANMLAGPAKVIWLAAFFSNSKHFFVQHLC